MSDVLARICDIKRADLAERKVAAPLADIERTAADAPPTRGFVRAIERTIADDRLALIAEIKKASPSKGLIRADFDPPALAKAYEEGGATCLSILTEEPHFQGSDAFLRQASAASTLPCLRKDFMLDPYQVVEARAIGADCILLIMAALSDDHARELAGLARELGLDVLVEVHDGEELDRALRLDARLIGINNRNLKTLEIDLATTEQLAPRVPEDRLLVAESGLYSHADLLRMAEVGARCFLVGESLMREANVTAATRRLLQGEGQGPRRAISGSLPL
ncbi:MAG: indole-3-glycerol phosphate synthase TrpC [Pseudomonadota bacterium]